MNVPAEESKDTSKDSKTNKTTETTTQATSITKKDEKKDHRHPANEAYQPRDDMHARNNQVAVEKKPLVTEIKKTQITTETVVPATHETKKNRH